MSPRNQQLILKQIPPNTSSQQEISIHHLGFFRVNVNTSCSSASCNTMMDDSNPLNSTNFPVVIWLTSFVVTGEKPGLTTNGWWNASTGACKETLLKVDEIGTKQERVLEPKRGFLTIISNVKKSPENANNNTKAKICKKLLTTFTWD